MLILYFNANFETCKIHLMFFITISFQNKLNFMQHIFCINLFNKVYFPLSHTFFLKFKWIKAKENILITKHNIRHKI